jgi:hypothetical protein
MASKPITPDEKELYRQYRELINLNAQKFQATQAAVTQAYEIQLLEMRNKV